MLSECLGDSSMRLGVPFIAPWQLGAVGGQLGRPNLPFVGWCTGQYGAPLDSYCSCLVRDLLPYLAHPTVGPRGQLAHRTVWCAQPTVSAGHASPADCTADLWLTGQFGAPPNGPVNYSRTPLRFPESSRFTAGQPGAPNIVRCAWPELVLVAHSQLFSFSFPLLLSLFLALRQTY
jgi:hypothetical protein